MGDSSAVIRTQTNGAQPGRVAAIGTGTIKEMRAGEGFGLDWRILAPLGLKMNFGKIDGQTGQ